MAEENKTTAEETAEEVKETEAVEDEVTEATPETQAHALSYCLFCRIMV